jgi:hypothetical protein
MSTRGTTQIFWLDWIEPLVCSFITTDRSLPETPQHLGSSQHFFYMISSIKMSQPVKIYIWKWNVTSCGMDPQDNWAGLGSLTSYFPGPIFCSKFITVANKGDVRTSWWTNMVKIMCWSASDLCVFHSIGQGYSNYILNGPVIQMHPPPHIRRDI